MSDFSKGLHVTGRAHPDRVVCATHNPGVQIRIAPSLRQQWAALAMAERVILQSRAAIDHYKQMERGNA
jgi:hypothetical protein